MRRLHPFRSDLLALLILFILPLLWFAPVLFPGLTGATLLPFDNLYSFEPWRSLQPGLVPHNNLLSDLVLENAVWKLHIRQALAQGELPLWNPQIFTGLPFLAAGQASTLYPLSLLFYVLPLEAAYGWFTALQIGLAGANLYAMGRVLRLRPPAALLAGVAYMFSGFLVVSVVFTMFIAAAAWLPLLLAVVEFIARKQEEKGCHSFRPIPYVAAGALAIGVMILAGHPELIYYTLLVAGAYSALRLAMVWRTVRPMDGGSTAAATRTVLALAGWLAAMAGLGIALGAVQLLPLVELLPLNFRAGSASLQQVLDWAWPTRHVLTFALPNLFGNPSHHRWLDLWSGQWVAASANALGQPTDTIFWGIKNYVEGGNYLGLLTWLLAGLAVAAGFTPPLRRRLSSILHSPFSILRPIPFFAALALLSLLFAFGTPLYAVLFYGLPGWDQLHSPFRWVFPFTLSMAVLGGIGFDIVWRLVLAGALRRALGGLVRTLALMAMLAGLGALAAVLLSRLWPEPFVRFGQAVVDGSDLAQAAFAGGRMFWGYQALNLLHFGFAALSSGLLLWWATRCSRRSAPWLAVAAVALVTLDLFAAHGRFNPAADPALSPLAAGRPPVVNFIAGREAFDPTAPCPQPAAAAPWRFTTFDVPGEKTFNANAGMYFGWQDLRGYDSVIPRQYAELMERIAPQANELLYNRIAPLYSNAAGETYAILDNPLLDLLNVKYVLTEHYLPNPAWREVYRDPSIGVYENQEVLERAFIVPEAQVVAVADQPLLTADLRRTLFIEEPPADPNALVPASPQLADARVSCYSANYVLVDVNLSDRGWLLLTDAYFPGWKAYVRPFGADESQEQELAIHRANGALRAVYLPDDGQWTVRFVYSPMSFKLGLYVSFIAFMTILYLLAWWGWGKYYRPESTAGDVRTVAKNSAVPMTLSLANKAIDFAFAMLYVRLLGPAGTGSYAFVVSIYGFFEIISRYGLGTLLTRDVAADKNQSSRYLTNVLALRTLLWLASLPVLALVTYGFWAIGNVQFVDASGIGPQEIAAIAILAVAMLFANWADALSSLFSAFEKMEYPAGLANGMALLKVSLGALVLLLGWGFVGLAVVSLLVNIVQVIWLYSLVRGTLFRPEWRWDWPLQQWMFQVSGPLMINHLLATIFWRIDIWILRPLAGAASVGLYSAALKYLDGLNIIPSVFTMAIFPLMSRYARQEGQHLHRSYVVSVRLLAMVSLPIAVTVTFLAEPLIFLIGGAQYIDIPETITLFGRTFTYLGGSDLALQVIIWSIPIGFVNSVTQFVLIAVNQQRYLTRAFILGVVFNVVGNLLVIPTFGYIGAAVVTILSEFSLLFPFYYSVRRHVGPVPWARVYVLPGLATAGMVAAVYLLAALSLPTLLAVAIGWPAYALLLVGAGAVRREELLAAARALPVGPLRRLAARSAHP